MPNVFYRSASISADGTYRYRLTRIWDGLKPTCAFVMLNPSTADGESDDPTIRKCIGFADRWGFGSIIVINAFAYRATSPAHLKSVYADLRDGPGNAAAWGALLRAAENDPGSKVIAAWGNHAPHDTWQRFAQHGYRGEVHCLGRTGQQQPKHPLYVPYDTELTLYLHGGQRSWLIGP